MSKKTKATPGQESEMLSTLNTFMKDFGIDEIQFGKKHSIKKTERDKARAYNQKQEKWQLRDYMAILLNPKLMRRVRFELDNGKAFIDIMTDVPNDQLLPAAENWLVRTEEQTSQSLCDYINSKTDMTGNTATVYEGDDNTEDMLKIH